MKKIWKVLLIVLLLAGLLLSGGLAYRALSAKAPASPSGSGGTNEASRRNASVSEPTPSPADPAVPGAPSAAPEPAPPEPTPPVLADELTADFRVLDENGDYVQLSDSFGTPVVVNFWATWCPPCRNELPHFDAAFQQYGDRVRFMMVDLTDGGTDTVESATAFMRDENGYRFPLYFDVDYSGVEAYAINAIPMTLFIRADGSLLYQQIGMLDEQTLFSLIEELLD